MIKSSLLLLAHGSRHQQSNLEFKDLCSKIQKDLSTKYNLIRACFLELSEPSLETSIQEALNLKSSRIIIFPYFLNRGNHVTQDIPKIVKNFQEKHPTCDFVVQDYIGKNPKIIVLITDHLNQILL